MSEVILDTLERLLTNYGFKLGEGDVLFRTVHPLQHSVWCSQHKSQSEQKRVNLGCAVFDPFLERPDYVLTVVMNLRPDGAFYKEVDSSWWKQSESDSLSRSMVEFGFRWFKERAALRSQSEIFETCISRRSLLSDALLAISSVKPKDNKEIENIPAAYLYSSALLHFHRQNQSLARLRANEYLQRVRRIKIPGEPERTLRQLEALATGC